MHKKLYSTISIASILKGLRLLMRHQALGPPNRRPSTPIKNLMVSQGGPHLGKCFGVFGLCRPLPTHEPRCGLISPQACRAKRPQENRASKEVAAFFPNEHPSFWSIRLVPKAFVRSRATCLSRLEMPSLSDRKPHSEFHTWRFKGYHRPQNNLITCGALLKSKC